jgi:hypothetical protein
MLVCQTQVKSWWGKLLNYRLSTEVDSRQKPVAGRNIDMAMAQTYKKFTFSDISAGGFKFQMQQILEFSHWLTFEKIYAPTTLGVHFTH